VLVQMGSVDQARGFFVIGRGHFDCVVEGGHRRTGSAVPARQSHGTPVERCTTEGLLTVCDQPDQGATMTTVLGRSEWSARVAHGTT
jgi:hypothetical protein